MTSAETHTANTLKVIRRSVMADSAFFGDRLKLEAAMPVSAGYSDLFMDAYSGEVEKSASAGSALESNTVSESQAVDTVRLGIEYIFEGYLLHYGVSRLLGPDEGDFHLLAGDFMYARGLEAIARLEDLASIEALAELVRLCSYIHCEKLDPGLAAKSWAVTMLGLAARISSGNTTPFSGMPAFEELDKLDERLEELLAAHDRGGANSGESSSGLAARTTSLRERFSNIEADFHGS